MLRHILLIAWYYLHWAEQRRGILFARATQKNVSNRWYASALRVRKPQNGGGFNELRSFRQRLVRQRLRSIRQRPKSLRQRPTGQFANVRYLSSTNENKAA